jgi:hypothetical protein
MPHLVFTRKKFISSFLKDPQSFLSTSICREVFGAASQRYVVAATTLLIGFDEESKDDAPKNVQAGSAS